MREDGVDKELAFPNAILALFHYPDKELRELAFSVYNEYIAELQEQSKGHFYGAGLIEMLQQAAEVINGRRVPLKTVPVLTPHLSSYWIGLVTDVDPTTARNLIDSMSTEVVQHDLSIRELVPGEPLTYAESVRRALAERT